MEIYQLHHLENIVYHFFRQLWLVLEVKLMEINSNGCFPGSYKNKNALHGESPHQRIVVCFSLCWWRWSDQRSHHPTLDAEKEGSLDPTESGKSWRKKKPGDFETRKKMHGVSGFQGSPEKRSTKKSPTWISRKMQHLKQPKPPSMTFGFQRILVCWGVKFFPFSRVLRDFGGHPWDGWTQINTHVLL